MLYLYAYIYDYQPKLKLVSGFSSMNGDVLLFSSFGQSLFSVNSVFSVWLTIGDVGFKASRNSVSVKVYVSCCSTGSCPLIAL